MRVSELFGDVWGCRAERNPKIGFLGFVGFFST